MSWQSKSAAVAIAIMAMSLHSSSVQAMPEQGKVVAGQGEIVRPDDKTMVINQKTDRLALDWQKFNIAKDEKVHFDQNSKSAIAINRVVGDGRSIIDGSLSATGNVFVINPNGVLFGKNSSVDVGGLVASTANVTDEDMRNFTQGKGDLGLQIAAGREASVINAGTIKAEGGLVALHATTVENTGTIANEGGTTALAAAKNLNIAADTAGKLNFTVNGSLANAKALNSGTLQSDGGYIVMTAKSAGDVMSTVVNNTGIIEAKTLHTNDKGEILLDGGNSGPVEVSGTLNASGMEAGQSAGSIKVIGAKTIVNDGTNLLARGAIDGGKIETSGDVLNLGNNLNIDAKGERGKAGEWLLDPLDVIIADKDPTTTSNYDKADKKTATDSDFTEGSASIGYNDPAATDANASSVNSAVTWIPTDMVEKMLNEGTDVTIQAAANNGSANIIVKNDIEKTAGKDATFTLDAMRNITINGNISSTYNKMNVVLNADSNGDQIGAVIINANINTNGGDFTSASGGNVTYTSDEAKTKGYGNGTLTGKADPAGHTVGTYFGHVDSSGTADGKNDDRLIKTGGGNITLNGEIAIGLNGGTLTLDSGGGAVTATGIINSGNSYGAYVYGTDTWNTLVEQTVEDYLKKGTVPAYHYKGVNYVKDGSNYVKNADGTYQYTTDAQSFSNGQPHYTFSEADTQNVRWLGDGRSTSVSTSAGTGYASVVITKGSMTLEQWLTYQLTYNAANFANRYISQTSGVKVVTEKVGNKTYTYVRNTDNSNVTTAQFKDYLSTALKSFKGSTSDTVTTLNGQTLYANIKDDISHLLATNWFASKELAQGNTKGGSAAGASYLATITTILENSLTTPNGQQILWAGGRGSGVLNKKGSNNSANDKLYPYSFYGMPDDPTYQDGMYWVTGPEGEANNGKGTQFYSNAGSNWQSENYGKAVYGYVNWDTYKDGNKIRSQPDNSAPFLTVGFGTTGKWDDAAMGGDTTVGFVKETNLANSSLNIKAGSGTVNLEGDLGKAKALDTVNIESTGAVTLGNLQNTATTYHNGTVYADHGIYISGGTVTVGGEIHSGTTDKKASASDITSRTDGYQNTAFQLDSVTIKSAGALTVHGVESNGYTDSNNTLNGGKISLTSTGDNGKIILGAGVDYNGKATDGTLAAASAEQGAVVVDAQGSKGSLVNSTTGASAITTGENGTWQVYVNSPSDYGTSLGSNLNSGTNAQWTAKSDANATVTTNSSNKKLTDYTDTSSNKFIFQVTPVITISGGYTSKTYGDTLSKEKMAETLTSKAIYRDSKGSDIDVTGFKNNFDESSYLDYVISSDSTKKGLSTVNVSSEGAKDTAVRTKGNEKVNGTETYKTADDKNRAFYVMDVAYQDGVKTLNGYDKAANPGEVEITRKTLTINTDATQTYGNAHVTSRTTKDYSTQLVNGDTLDVGDITYTIATDSTYATSKGSNTTAHAGTYKNQYLTSGAGVKASDGNDASTNYAVTGSGTITVKPADLYLTIGDVSTTYGTAFDTDKYTYTVDKEKGGLVNGDTQASVLGDKFLSYTNTGDATEDAKAKGARTGAAGTTYKLTGSYNPLNDYTVHITDGKSIVNKAVLVVNTTGHTRTYGDVSNVASDVANAASFHVSGSADKTVNGDTEADILRELGLSTSSDAQVKDKDGKVVKTGNANTDPGYDIKAAFKKDLTNYTVSEGTVGKEKIEKAALVVDTTGNTRTYGDVSNVASDVANAASFHVSGSTDKTVNGDTEADILKELGLSTSSAAQVKDEKGKVIKTGNANTDPGYDIKAAFKKDLTNYTVSEGTVGKEKIEKAALVVDTTGNTRTYGDVSNVASDVANAASFHVSGSTDKTVNGDTEADILKELGLSTSSAAQVKDEKGKVIKTGNANTDPGYDIKAAFKKDLTNYTVSEGTVGKEKIEKATLNLANGKYTVTYGDVDSINDKLAHATTITGFKNNDTAESLKDELKLVNTSEGENGALLDENRTNDVGIYNIRTDFNPDMTNYNVVLTTPGTITLTPKSIAVKNTMTQQYGSPEKTFSEATVPADQLANGDRISTKDLKFGIVSGGKYDTSLKENQAQHEGTVSADAGTYSGELTHTGGGITHEDGTDAYKNYKVTVEGDIIVTPADLTVKINDASTQYGMPFDEESGKKSYDYTVVSGNANGDTKAEVKGLLGKLKNYKNAGVGDNGRATQDVGSYGITGEQAKTLSNYTVHVEKGTATITPAPLTIKTDDVTIDYGTAYKTTVGKTVSSVTGLTNGDAEKASDLSYNYGNYGGGYIENNTKTNHVGGYDFKTTVSNKSEDFLKNYTISGGDARLTINPKDVYFHVDGNGNTLGDVVYTVTDPNNPSSPDPINRQLVYGETVTPSYMPDGRLPNGHYGVSTSLPGYGPIDSGKVYGNYRYHYDGDITVNLPSKPDIVPPVNPPVTPGTGTVTPLPETPENTSNTPENTTETTGHKTVWDGDRDRGGDRPEDKRVVTLPFFKVLEDKTTHRYGTYDVAKRTTEVKIAPSAQVLPEPNQPATQYRELDTELTTDKGTGKFTLKYNGSRFTILPDDDAATQLIVVGDETKNRDLFEKALHVAFTKMGLEVADLDGVYIHFGKE